MKLEKIITADKIINSLDKLPLKTGYDLFKLHKVLEPQLEFQQKEAEKLYEKYPYTTDGTTLTFKSVEDKQGFENEVNELMNMDIELEFVRPIIKLDNNINLTVKEIEVLSEFIDFE